MCSEIGWTCHVYRHKVQLFAYSSGKYLYKLHHHGDEDAQLYPCAGSSALREASSRFSEPSDVADSELIEQLFGLQFTLTRSHLKAKPGSACAVTEDQVRWYQINWHL